MSCEEIAAGLQAIANAISGLTFPASTITQTNENNCSGGGCDGGGITGVITPTTPSWYQGSVEQPSGEIVPIFGTDPPMSVEPETWPEGYTSREEYELDKCQLANGIIDGLIQTLHNFSLFGVWNAAALVGLLITAVVGLILLPPAGLALIGMMVGVLSVNITILELAANHISENRQEWVCALYESDTVEEMISVLADLIDAMIALVPTLGPYGTAVKTIVLTLMNGDTLNQLMKKTAHIQYPDADCSTCGNEATLWEFVEDIEGWVWSMVSGTMPAGEEGGWSPTDTNNPDTGSLTFEINTTQSLDITQRWEREFTSAAEFTDCAVTFVSGIPITQVQTTVFSNLGNVVDTRNNITTTNIAFSFTARTAYKVRIDITFTTTIPSYDFGGNIFFVGLD